MKTILSTLFLGLSFSCFSQNLYFPPNGSTTWDTLSSNSLGWCSDSVQSLYNFLDNQDSKAFILLKDGKIVLEKYFDNFTPDSSWYWASAGKTLTATVVGVAQQDGHLKITDTTSSYLGNGWTSLTSAQEEQITIRHQLEMTTGLDDANNADCTDDTCLIFKAQPDTRWAYHNAPYTLLQDVVGNATSKHMNIYTFQKVLQPIGGQGLFVKLGNNKVFFSKPRSMARFGLLLLAKGNWNGTAVLSDSSYFNAMVNSSQNINPAYGYLTWLNGKSTFKLPQSQMSFQGSIIPDAPADMYAALGANDQIINVIPSQNLVFIRMGNAASVGSLVPTQFNNEIWKRLNRMQCIPMSVSENENSKLQVFPNPFENEIRIEGFEDEDFKIEVFDGKGVNIFEGENHNVLNTKSWNDGVYFLRISNSNGKLETRKIMK